MSTPQSTCPRVPPGPNSLAAAAQGIDRRAIIGAAMIAPLTAVAFAREPASATTTTEWDQALAEMQRLSTLVRVSDEKHAAAFKAFQSEMPSIEMIDWKEFPFSGRPTQVADAMDVEDHWQTFLAQEGLWWSANPEQTKAKRRAALDSIVDYRRLKSDTAQRHNINALVEENERLADLLNEAEHRLMFLPSPNAEALAWKFDYLFGGAELEPYSHCSSWPFEWVKPVIDDALRLPQGGEA